MTYAFPIPILTATVYTDGTGRVVVHEPGVKVRAKKARPKTWRRKPCTCSRCGQIGHSSRNSECPAL